MAGLAGRTLDRYELHELIGRGGMADVYLGYDPRFEREVAVKVFKRGEDEDLLRRFVREARLMASLHNSHLMPVYDTGETRIDGTAHYYIVMPFMEGGSLRSLIRNQGSLSLHEVCNYLSDIAEALDYVHSRGIIHRDIKSSNVLLDAEDHCYLADFGIARTSSEATQMTSTGNVLGTVDYIAPELFESNRKADARSDLYSLGVLLFEMVTGHLPFSGENQLAVVAMHVTRRPPSPRSFVPTLSPQVERVMLKALEKKPEMRYGSAGELAAAFYRAVADRQAGEYPANREQDIADVATVPAEADAPLVLPPPQERQRTSLNTQPAYRSTPDARLAPRPPVSVPTMPQSPAPQASGAQARVVTAIALVTLLVVIVPMVYVLFTNQHHQANTNTPLPIVTATASAGAATPSPTIMPTATPNATATAQAVAASATQQAQNATATAVAGATATVQAQAAATVGVVQTATAGKALYQDPLTDANTSSTQNEQWDQNKHCAFQQDGYHVLASPGILGQAGLVGCREAATQYANATFSVDVAIKSGHSGGLFFYVTPNALGAYAGYLFEVDTQGNYKITRSANFNTGDNTEALQDWTASAALKAGAGAKNRLQVIARNGSLLFYINGAFVGQQSDSTFSSGYVGFLATTAAQGGQDAEVVYSNLAIYQA